MAAAFASAISNVNDSVFPDLIQKLEVLTVDGENIVLGSTETGARISVAPGHLTHFGLDNAGNLFAEVALDPDRPSHTSRIEFDAAGGATITVNGVAFSNVVPGSLVRVEDGAVKFETATQRVTVTQDGVSLANKSTTAGTVGEHYAFDPNGGLVSTPTPVIDGGSGNQALDPYGAGLAAGIAAQQAAAAALKAQVSGTNGQFVPNYNPTGTVNNSYLNVQSIPVTATWSSSGQGIPDWQQGFVMQTSTHMVHFANANVPGIINRLTGDLVADGIIPGTEQLSTQQFVGIVENLIMQFGNQIGSAEGLAAHIAQGGTFESYSEWVIGQSIFNVNALFREMGIIAPTDPLVLDLDGDGIELTPFQLSGTLFDVDADGYREQTGWVSADDGILVMDVNGNGEIDDMTEVISEYFAPGAANSLEALRTLESNGDGIFSVADAQFGAVRVWRDANLNGRADAGELVTLQSLGIASISLAALPGVNNPIAGNDVLARTTYTTTDGQQHQVAAVAFAGQTDGVEIVTDATGFTSVAEDGTRSYYVIDPAGTTVNAVSRNVQTLYGGTGNDTLIGDDGDNWLAGLGGSDVLIGGAGDDILIIDADDLQANIDGGTGFDTAIIVDTRGVTLNLAATNIETVFGGDGHDVLIGGGATNVFIDGGAGNDVILGGLADDALSGGEGDDFIDGGDGDDLIRGHAGNDWLYGGNGDDWIDGGLGDDVIDAGAGNDTIIASAGTDLILGGTGFDTVRFNGSYADYLFTRNGTDWVIEDKRDAANVAILRDVESLAFNDVSSLELDQQSPLPVNDTVLDPGTGAFVIAKAQLLGNDVDLQGDTLRIKSVLNAVGGTVSLTAQGDVLFTPTAGFFGVRRFEYTIEDSAGNGGTVLTYSETGEQAEMKGVVSIRGADDPDDPLFYDQWYLSDANILPVWKDYTGAGVKMVMVEAGGILNYDHPDLWANIDEQYLTNYPMDPELISKHATLVAGVMVASRDGTGSVGVAYDATLSSFMLRGPYAEEVRYADYDVANNSWTFLVRFGSNFTTYPDSRLAIEEGAAWGRNGLGTAMVFGAGNNRAQGDNSNYQSIANNRFSIAVGAINAGADLGTLVIGLDPFSNPGSNLLVSAPGSNIASTSNLLTNSRGSTFGDDHEVSQGTSFAAPIVSGIIALMLEANPNLGYRDIQKILAYSAAMVDATGSDWSTNGAFNWNGGGLHVSHDYGFGQVDALAAVRLAETWTAQQTYYNE